MGYLTSLTPEDIAINDPFVGKVYANVLDFFDNPSYNLRLYMVRESAYNNVIQKLNNGEFGTSTIVAPSDMIVLAQTGVTGVQIDNLEIQALSKYDGGVEGTTVSFQIKEPGGASFLDQIQYAKSYLGYDAKCAIDNFMFLDIRFQGYKTDNVNFINDMGGELDIIAGPMTYQLTMTEFNLRLTEAGSEYDFKGLVGASFSFSDSAFTFPLSGFATKGTTITEHVKSLEDELNRWSKEDSKAKQADTYEIDLSEILGSSSATTIQDDTVIDNIELKESSVFVPNADSAITQTSEEKEANATGEIKASQSTPEETTDIIIIRHTKGETIEKILERIFANNKEYLSKTTRRKDPADPNSESDTAQATVSFLKVLSKSDFIGYDSARNRYARAYKYIPVLNKTANTNVEEADAKATDEKDKVTRLKQLKAGGHLVKSYNYYFTGLNDQIKDLTVEYNSAVVSLLPPKGGAVGNPAITNLQLAPSTEENKDLSLGGVVNDILGKAKGFSDFAKSIDIFDKVGELAGNLQDEFIGQASGFLGIDSDTLRTALGDREAAQGILGNLLGEEIAGIASAQFLPAGNAVNTETPAVTNLPDGSPYKPELSPYRYTADLLSPSEIQGQVLTADDLERLGYINAEGVQFVEPQPAVDSKRTPESSMESSPIEVGSVSNKLYGFLSESAAGDIFMMDLEMTIRGDPWYLSSTDPTSSTGAEQSNFARGPNCFWLRIDAPRKYDLDYTDEDANTGYWPPNDHSKTYSGIYQLISVVNRFNGGVFETDLKAYKITGLNEPASESLKDTLENSREEALEKQKEALQAAKDNKDPTETEDDNPPTGGEV